MNAAVHSTRHNPGPTYRQLFTPKLVTVLREGYGSAQLRADVVAGLTVAIVALPLSMAIAIASGVSPDRGLYTAIVGGFLVSLLGGSRFQIGGPAGAFIVLVAATVARHGVEGLILATMMSGLFLVAVGYLRLGTYIKFIPYPVTVGFTAGIAVIIFASQISELFGLTLDGREPGELVAKLEALAAAAGTVNASAVVADGMTGRRHRSNCELVAQGFANIGSSLFGGICVTGTIARTATNVRAGAHGPVAGMLHALFLLFFILAAAPLASYIPLAALAGVLAVVAWNMVEKTAFAALIRSSWGDALVLLVTFALVVFRDLTEGIVVGFALGSVLFIDRMSKAIHVEALEGVAFADVADTENGNRPPYDPAASADPDTVVYRISGAFFFGAASAVAAVLDRIADQRRNFVLDCSAVPFLDSTAANVIEGAARKARRAGVRFIITGAAPQVRRMLFQHGVRPPLVRYKTSTRSALEQLRNGRRSEKPAAATW